jgi:hypothetical protein
MRVLELGSYLAPAYGGMILAEQGHEVQKWTSGRDPILDLDRGDELWEWVNHGKTLATMHATHVGIAGGYDVILDNIRAETWEKWGIDPALFARDLGVVWVSLRDDLDGRSFDAIAQARAWMTHSPYVPFYIGDTAAGLWMAFKALSEFAAGRVGHHVIRQAASLAKLVEGELVIDVERRGSIPPWDERGTYQAERRFGAEVKYRGEWVCEPVRGREWQLAHFANEAGRIII